MKCYQCGGEVQASDERCPKCGCVSGFSGELIDRAAGGDQEAVSELYNRTYNSVYQSVRMLIKDEYMALDIVQDTYIRGFRHLDQLRDPGQFRAWIRRIGMNTAKNYLKKKQPLFFSEMENDDFDAAAELQLADERKENLPEVTMEQQETARLIGEILDDLSEEQRTVITLYYYDEMNAREIADFLDTNENTVRSRLNYGKKKIEEKVLAIEKRDGIRLHSLAPIPFLLLLFRSQKAHAAERPNSDILQAVQNAVTDSAAGIQGAESAAGSIGTKTAAGAAAKGIGAKTAVIIAAAAIVIGGGTIYGVQKHRAASEEPPAQVSTETLETSREMPETDLKAVDSEEGRNWTDIFQSMPKEFTFASGAGGWATEMTLNEDGTFSGRYHASSPGERGDAYPDGTVYICDFQGKFTDPKQIDTYTYSMQLEYLNTEGNAGDEYYENNIRYSIWPDAYGFENADEFLIYVPGIRIADLPEGFTGWLRAFLNVQETETLPYYGIYNTGGDTGFVAYDAGA